MNIHTQEKQVGLGLSRKLVQDTSNLCILPVQNTHQLIRMAVRHVSGRFLVSSDANKSSHRDIDKHRRAKTCSPLIGAAAICKSLSLHRSKIKPLLRTGRAPCKNLSKFSTWCRIEANGSTNQKAHGNSPTTDVLMIAHHPRY